MRPSPVITLTTDFGTRDGYVAAIKGVILSINPGATVVDVSHDLPAHDIPHAAYVLGSTCPYYPAGTVHVAVVDPGVGTDRRPVLLTTPQGVYLAPDNGLLTYVLADQYPGGELPSASADGADAFLSPRTASVPPGCTAYVPDRDEYWRRPTSDTFHGRDVFAPVAAHLSLGVKPDRLGHKTNYVTCLNMPVPIKRGDFVLGRVIYDDRFGNLVTNLRAADIDAEGILVEIMGSKIDGLSRAYEGSQGLLAVIGSQGYLEVSVDRGNAARLLGATVGTEVKVTLCGNQVSDR